MDRWGKMGRMKDIQLKEVYKNTDFGNLASKYSALVDGNVKWVKFKYGLILIFIILTLYSAFFDAFNLPLSNKKHTYNAFWLIPILISLIVVHILAIILHVIVALSTLVDAGIDKQVCKKKLFKEGLVQIKEQWERSGTNKIKRFLNVVKFVIHKILKCLITPSYFLKIVKYLITPDYFWAEYYKRKIGSIITDAPLITPYYVEYIRLAKKFYIERCNWSNIIITIIIAIICFVSFSKEPLLYGWVPFSAFTFILYRTISRVMEILIAFYYDIVKQREKIFYFFEDEDNFKTINQDVVNDIASNQNIGTVKNFV